MKAVIIAVVVIALIVVGAALYFYYQNQAPPDLRLNNIDPEIDRREQRSGNDDNIEIQDTQAIDSNLAIGSDKTVNKQASFAIFTNGTFRIFTDPMYHNLSDDVFIQSTNPNIIRIKKEGVTWNDFFKTLPFKLTKDCLTTGTGQNFCSGENGTLKFYLNGQLEPEALKKEIKQADKLLISFGDDSKSNIEAETEKIPDL